MSSLFLRTKIVCAKMISSWVEKILSIARLYIYLHVLTRVLWNIGFGGCVSLLSILEAGNWARVSTPARHYFSTYITITDWH